MPVCEECGGRGVLELGDAIFPCALCHASGRTMSEFDGVDDETLDALIAQAAEIEAEYRDEVQALGDAWAGSADTMAHAKATAARARQELARRRDPSPLEEEVPDGEDERF